MNISNLQLLEQSVACFGIRSRREEYFSLYADDIVLHGYAGVEPGLPSVKQFYYAFWQAFPDASIEIKETFEAGDRIALRYVITGSLQSSFGGIVPRGQPIALPGMSILHFRGGQCHERWACSDSQVLLRQLSASE